MLCDYIERMRSKEAVYERHNQDNNRSADIGTVSDGTALEDLGYEVVAADNSGNPLAVPAFVVNGGVIVEWEVRYPETVAAGDQAF